MYGQQNIKICDAKQAKQVYQYKNIKIKLYKNNAAVWNGMVLQFYQQQESSTTKTVHKVINKGLKTYV